MAKFNFRLQPLLNVKMQLEDSMKNELGKATRKLEYEKDVLVEIQNEMIRSIDEVNSSSSNGIAVEKLRQYGKYISLLRDKTILQKENINIAQGNVDKCREELIKAAREREMFEKLKEKKYLQFIIEENKAEQKSNDELISYNYSKT